MSSSMPPAGSQPGPEYLEEGGGAPLAREPRTGGGRRKAVLAGATVVGLAAIGGGVWAATSFFATGAQPAEALPASTIGYASVDLDPSGGQKIEILRMLNKFPAYRDQIGVGAGDDIKQKIFDEAGLSQVCDGLDYAKDIAPWLGDRAAVAAVDLGKAQPTPAAVLQVTDGDAAAEGLAKIRECAGDDNVGWSITGDWAVVAETQSLAEEIDGQAAKATLADDATYQKWTGEVGDAGVLNLYAAPEAGDYVAENLDGLAFPLGPMTGRSSHGGPGYRSSLTVVPKGPELSDEMVQGLKKFTGAAATLRFNDGALELESVGDPALLRQSHVATSAGDDVLASLPDDTAAAVGVGFQDGWATVLLDQVAGAFGNGNGADDPVAKAEQLTGLKLPEDLETLFGDSTVVAVGPGFDPHALGMGGIGGGVPVGIKVKGDAQAIEGVLDKVRTRLGLFSAPLQSRSKGDVVAVGPDDKYLARILQDGGLGDSEAFQNVVREADQAGAIVFVNFDASGDWLGTLADGHPQAKENLAPLEGLGVSVWQDGDTGHALVRLTTS